MGAIIATGLYWTLKYIGYWRVNPGADSTSPEHSALGDLHRDGPAENANANTGRNANSTYPNAEGNYGTHQHNGSGSMHGRYVAGGRGVHEKGNDVNVNLTNGNHTGTAMPRSSDATFTNDHAHAVGANGEKLGRPINQSDRSPV